MGKKYNNLISTTAGFKYTAEQPLDDREVVESFSDLADLVSANSAYEGMKVYVVADKKTYELVSSEWKAIATEGYVDTKIAEVADNIDLSDYAKKSDIPDVTDFISEIPEEYVTETELASKTYATETYVKNAIAEAELNEKEVDLSGYATKDDIKGFIKSIPAEYVTELELDAKGFLTEHQSLEGLATESYVIEAIPKADKTLSIDGAPADANTVGIMLSALNQRFDNLDNIESGLDSTDDGEGNVTMQFLYIPLAVTDDELGNVAITL